MTPPPFYKVLHEKTSTLNQTLGVFNTREEANDYLEDLLEEYHESMADAEDYHHRALDNRFWTSHKIVKVK
jgi:hypothetical protein